MPRIPIFGFGQASKSPYVTAKQLTNVYCEQRPAGEKSIIVGYATPGLNLFADFGATPARGAIAFPKTDTAFIVHRGTLWEVDNVGVKTSRGALLTTSGRVSMSHNGVQVMIVDGTYGYIYNTTTTGFAQITDNDFPALPATCCFLSRRFVASFTGSSRFYWSDLNDGLSWDALNFANAESNPDPIIAIYTNNGQLVPLGFESTEFWGNSGIADPAFVPLQGSANEWGLVSPWSIAKYDNSFAFLMKNRGGQASVAKMEGYLPKKISTVDMDAIINSYTTLTDASAYSYMLGGHAMYVISFPSASATWLFDGSTGFWTALKSFNLTRHLGEFSFNFVNKTVVTDYADGKLYTLADTALTDNGASIEREVIGETITSKEEEFIPVDCLRLDMETGVGLVSGQGVNPQVSLSVSRDNGKTWGPDMWKTAGALGEYKTRVEWRRLGTPRYFTPKIRMVDPVRTVFVSACLNPEN